MSKFQLKGEAMQTQLQEQLSRADAEVILDRLPQRIQTALVAHAAEIEYPIEAVIEMAIASFLDTEALGFVDCKPGRGQ
jgi:adenylate kinase family enzyme